jgi:hypothetical protein
MLKADVKKGKITYAYRKINKVLKVTQRLQMQQQRSGWGSSPFRYSSEVRYLHVSKLHRTAEKIHDLRALLITPI